MNTKRSERRITMIKHSRLNQNQPSVNPNISVKIPRHLVHHCKFQDEKKRTNTFKFINIPMTHILTLRLEDIHNVSLNPFLSIRSKDLKYI